MNPFLVGDSTSLGGPRCAGYERIDFIVASELTLGELKRRRFRSVAGFIDDLRKPVLNPPISQEPEQNVLQMGILVFSFHGGLWKREYRLRLSFRLEYNALEKDQEPTVHLTQVIRLLR